MDLRFENLRKEYKGRRVVDIPSGEISGEGCFALMGPNGAGKTTLLNLIAGLDTPTEGEVHYKQETWSKRTPYDDMTLVFQKPYLLHTTVENNIKYPLKLRKWQEDAIDERVWSLLKELGLTAFAQQKAWTLSGGEMQKVALARAISFRPKLLLLDEPTASVDPATTGEIEEILKKIVQVDGIKILLVTHNLSQVKRVCSQAIFMHKGQMVEQGDARRLLQDPAQELTRKFVNGELLI